jgi:hypothetical protein
MPRRLSWVSAVIAGLSSLILALPLQASSKSGEDGLTGAQLRVLTDGLLCKWGGSGFGPGDWIPAAKTPTDPSSPFRYEETFDDGKQIRRYIYAAESSLSIGNFEVREIVRSEGPNSSYFYWIGKSGSAEMDLKKLSARFDVTAWDSVPPSDRISPFMLEFFEPDDKLLQLYRAERPVPVAGPAEMSVWSMEIYSYQGGNIVVTCERRW